MLHMMAVVPFLIKLTSLFIHESGSDLSDSFLINSVDVLINLSSYKFGRLRKCV